MVEGVDTKLHLKAFEGANDFAGVLIQRASSMPREQYLLFKALETIIRLLVIIGTTQIMDRSPSERGGP